MGLKKETKEDIIERIMEDISNNIAEYEKFVLGCVRDQVEKWEDDELLNWLPESLREEFLEINEEIEYRLGTINVKDKKEVKLFHTVDKIYPDGNKAILLYFEDKDEAKKELEKIIKKQKARL